MVIVYWENYPKEHYCKPWAKLLFVLFQIYPDLHRARSRSEPSGSTSRTGNREHLSLSNNSEPSRRSFGRSNTFQSQSERNSQPPSSWPKLRSKSGSKTEERNRSDSNNRKWNGWGWLRLLSCQDPMGSSRHPWWVDPPCTPGSTRCFRVSCLTACPLQYRRPRQQWCPLRVLRLLWSRKQLWFYQ